MDLHRVPNALGRHAPRGWRSGRGATATVLAFTVVWLVLVVPDDVRHVSPVALLRIPAEGLVLAAVLLALPARATRTARALPWVAGAALGVVLLAELADYGFYQVLDRPAHPVTDWRLLGNGLDYVTQTWGRAASAGLALGAAILAVGLPLLIGACTARVGGVLRRRRGAAVRPLAVLAVAWAGLALTGAQLVAGTPVAAHSVTAATADQLSRARADLNDDASFARQLASDRSRATATGAPLAGLRGKDVIFAFVESYGRSAVEDPGIAPGVDAVLEAGNRDLRAAGFSARSGFLTSSTFGGRSWLGHSTLMSGTWTDSQARYDQLLAGTHPTLVSDFAGAGWRTVATMPGTGQAWPEGMRFYGYDKLYISTALGYRGPAFSWSPMPDQFVLSQLQRLELGAGRTTPVLTTVELTSSHNPWAPLPTAVPWDAVGDGSVFRPQPKQGRQPADVWKDPAQVRLEYGRSIQYSVSTLLSFVEHYGTEDTVLVFLGDHQPVKIVTGDNASHDVPVAIVAKDPAVLERISSWGWTDGVHPRHDAPVWRMDAFREKFLAAFSTPAAR